MSRLRDRQGAAHQKAEALLAEKARKETERLNKRDKDRLDEDEKVARLRGLRLAKEAADLNEAKLAATGAVKKASTTA
jgi:hypothetical protein